MTNQNKRHPILGIVKPVVLREGIFKEIYFITKKENNLFTLVIRTGKELFDTSVVEAYADKGCPHTGRTVKLISKHLTILL